MGASKTSKALEKLQQVKAVLQLQLNRAPQIHLFLFKHTRDYKNINPYPTVKHCRVSQTIYFCFMPLHRISNRQFITGDLKYLSQYSKLNLTGYFLNN